MTTGFNTKVATSTGDVIQLTSTISQGSYTSATGFLGGFADDVKVNLNYGNNIVMIYANSTKDYLLSTNNATTWSINNTYTGLASTISAAPDGCIEHDGTIFYGAINNSYYCTSNDGITWTKVATNTWYYSPKSFAKNGSTVVWVGGSGACWYSTNGGVTWTINSAFQSGVGYSEMNKVIYASSKFVAVGTSGKCMTSTDGITWTSQTSLATVTSNATMNDVVYASGKFVAVGVGGKVATSPDGVTWTDQSNLRTGSFGTVDIYGISYENSQFFVCGGSGKLASSSDGITWTYISTLTSVNRTLTKLKYIGSQYVVVGYCDRIYKSTDLVTWTTDYTIADINFNTTVRNTIAYNGTIYIVGGRYGKISTSTDGINWTYRSGLSNTSWGHDTDVIKIIWANGKFIAGGTNGAIATSTDGITWTYQSGLSSTSFGASTVMDINWNGSQYVVIGRVSNGVATSPDGVTWTYQSSFSSTGVTPYAIAYGNNTYVVVGQTSGVATSPDGVTWTNRTGLQSITTGIAYSITYIKDRFYCGCAAGFLSYSFDGITWTQLPAIRSLGNWSAYEIANIVNDNGKILLHTTSTAQTAVSETFGQTFTNYTTISSKNIIFDNKRYLFLISTSGIYSGVFNPILTVDLDQILVRRDAFSSGNMWIWGGPFGTLGDGTTQQKSSPVTTAGGGANWKQVACGRQHTAAVKTDGTLWAWGTNADGQLGDGTRTFRSSPVTTAGGGVNWKEVSSGYGFTAAIKTDGTLWTWGSNASDRLGDGSSVDRSSPGTTAGGGANWKQVACGNSHVGAIKNDGTLWTWGNGVNGRLGTGDQSNRNSPGTTLGSGTNWKQVACGDAHTSAIKTDGTLWVWGNNNLGQLGTNNGTNYSSPVTTSGGGTNWKQVTCGRLHTAAVKTDGTLWVWGFNSAGQLGTNNTVDRSSPVTVAGGGTNWKQVGAPVDSDHTAAVKTDGTLWTWGKGGSGALGDGTTTGRSSPGTTAGGITNWKQVTCGYNTTAAVTDLSL